MRNRFHITRFHLLFSCYWYQVRTHYSIAFALGPDLLLLDYFLRGEEVLRFSATLVLVYGTLYSTFTKYVVLSRCYSVTKARPCTGRTLYKCLHTSLNLGKHINSSLLVHFSRLVQSTFLSISFLFSRLLSVL